MPIYDFICESCDHTFDKLVVSFSVKHVPCKKCGKTAHRAKITRGTNFTLKGGGWYADSYSKKPGES